MVTAHQQYARHLATIDAEFAEHAEDV